MEIYALMAEWLESHTKEEIFRACQSRRVPATPVLTVADVAESAHLRERGFFAEISSPTAGALRLPGAPYRFAATPWSLRLPAPALGAHNDLVFGEWLPSDDKATRRQGDKAKTDEASTLLPAEGEGTAAIAPLALSPSRLVALSPPPPPGADPAAYPLRGLRVANFGWVWAAPVAGHLLADMGAEVIKVESRRRVDITRKVPPQLGGQPDASFLSQNSYRDQLSVTLNLADPAAVDLARRLVAVSDVVIENFSPGVMARYGLAYPDLVKLRPDLLMISMSATGQSGPLRDIITYGSTLSALTGFDSLNGYDGERPLPMGTTFQDPLMGLYGAFAVLSALAHRRRTGEGQYIDMAQVEAAGSMLGAPLLDYFWNGRVAGPRGNRDPHMAPHGVYPTRPEEGGEAHLQGGRWIAVACRTDADWQALCAAAERPDWAADPRFATLAGRKAHEDDLDALLAGWTATSTNSALAERLQARGVPAAPALSTRELFEDPHYRARGSWVEVDHPYGRETIYGLPFHLSETPGGIRRATPLLGQDNSAIFEDLLGLPPAEVARLTASGTLT
jgi:benzylsuccinate CoA-transferase BbsF subunit